MAEHGNSSSGFVASRYNHKQRRAPNTFQLGKQANNPRLRNWLQSPAGRWATAALDPFHDEQIKVDGFPDLHAGQTTVQKVRIQFNVTRPAGVVSGNWDANIVALPLAYNQTFVQAVSGPSLEGFVGYTTGASQITLGPIQAFCAPSGTDTIPSATNLITQATNDIVSPAAAADLASYHIGPSRVIAAGFEVRDATANLYRQGQVYMSHVSNHGTDTVLSVNEMSAPTVIATGGRAYNGPAKSFALAAPSTDLLSKNPDQINWESAHGVYMPLRLESFDNPLETRSMTPIWLHETTATGLGAVGFVTYPNAVGANVTGDYVYATNAALPATGRYGQTIPFQTAQAYFKGLAADATLVVTYTCWIERAPTFWQNDLMAFATPSPPYDPYAFEIYMRAIRNKPVATKVGNNDAGDWWDDMLGTISNVAGKVSPFLAMIPEVGPIAMGVAGGVSGGAKALQSAGRAIQDLRRDVKKLKVNKPPPRPSHKK